MDTHRLFQQQDCLRPHRIKGVVYLRRREDLCGGSNVAMWGANVALWGVDVAVREGRMWICGVGCGYVGSNVRGHALTCVCMYRFYPWGKI